jgi:UDP:flavonoid glycosyltransferase YjiC (YdhE family)
MEPNSFGRASARRKPRVLFMAEAISLAHVARLAVLAESLDPRRYDVWFASAHFPELVFARTRFHRRTIESQSPHSTLARVARGQRPWDVEVLERYVASDLRVLREVRPDLVVGDFRLSLAVSAPLSGTQCASMINAYWSPHAARSSFPIPDHPLVRLLGVKRVARRYHFVLPLVFQHFAQPIARLRKRHGLPPLDGFLELLTFGDYTLYPDVPELAPTRDVPPAHRYLGTVSWSPSVSLPSFWEQMDHRLPLVYVTLGSSGELRALDAILDAARRLPITMLLATAGRVSLDSVPENVWVTDFVPGDVVSQRAALVVCNGGSTTGYQALEQGTPVLGCPSNFDQYLATDGIVRAGAGLRVRSGGVTPAKITHSIEQLLREDRFTAAAGRLQRAIERWDARRLFPQFVADALSAPREASSTSTQRT